MIDYGLWELDTTRASKHFRRERIWLPKFFCSLCNPGFRDLDWCFLLSTEYMEQEVVIWFAWSESLWRTGSNHRSSSFSSLHHIIYVLKGPYLRRCPDHIKLPKKRLDEYRTVLKCNAALLMVVNLEKEAEAVGSNMDMPASVSEELLEKELVMHQCVRTAQIVWEEPCHDMFWFDRCFFFMYKRISPRFRYGSLSKMIMRIELIHLLKFNFKHMVYLL